MPTLKDKASIIRARASRIARLAELTERGGEQLIRAQNKHQLALARLQQAPREVPDDRQEAVDRAMARVKASGKRAYLIVKTLHVAGHKTHQALGRLQDVDDPSVDVILERGLAKLEMVQSLIETHLKEWTAFGRDLDRLLGKKRRRR